MCSQKVRLLFVVALLSIMMIAGNVLPASAAQTFTPAPVGCSHSGTLYPVGTVLHFYLPYPPSHVWMRCEWDLKAWPGGMSPKWVFYDSNPS